MTSKAKTIILNEISKMKRKIWTKKRELERLEETVEELQKQADEMN